MTSKRDKETSQVAKDLYFSDTNLGKYLTDCYALLLDLCSIHDHTLHGNGKRIENASEGVTMQIEKQQESNGTLNIYLYIIQDAQINFENSKKFSTELSTEMGLPKYAHSAIICGSHCLSHWIAWLSKVNLLSLHKTFC